MREGRARPGVRAGTEWWIMLAVFALLGGIAGFIGLYGADAGTDVILQMLGIAAVRPSVEADFGMNLEAITDISSAGEAAGETVGLATSPDGSGQAAPDAAHGGVRTADVRPLPGMQPVMADAPPLPGMQQAPGSAAQPEPPVAIAEPSSPPEAATASQEREAPVPARRAALTFDDGPDGKYTPMVLDILSEYGIKVTFFVVGIQAERYPEVLARIRDEGHEIGSHGYAHADMGKMSAAAIAEDLRLADEALQEAADIVPALFRPPYGSVSDELKTALSDAGKTLVRWNVDPRDWDGTPAADIASRVLEHAKDGAVILLHSFGGKNADLSGTIEALPAIIEGLLAQGYELTTVSGLE